MEQISLQNMTPLPGRRIPWILYGAHGKNTP